MTHLPTVKGATAHQLTQIIVYHMAGIKQEEIATKVGLDQPSVSKALNHPQVLEYINDLASVQVKEALITLKTESSRLMKKAIAVLEKQLDEGDLDAVKIVISNIKPKEEMAIQSDGNLTIVMPGSSGKDT